MHFPLRNGEMNRVMLRLNKGEAVKYISHRDYVRAFEMALRRARVPVAYSSGFNPRANMSFGSAVGVGVESDDERILVELSKPIPPGEVDAAIAESRKERGLG